MPYRGASPDIDYDFVIMRHYYSAEKRSDIVANPEYRDMMNEKGYWDEFKMQPVVLNQPIELSGSTIHLQTNRRKMRILLLLSLFITFNFNASDHSEESWNSCAFIVLRS